MIRPWGSSDGKRRVKCDFLELLTKKEIEEGKKNSFVKNILNVRQVKPENTQIEMSKRWLETLVWRLRDSQSWARE